jgi:hypothetical protein
MSDLEPIKPLELDIPESRPVLIGGAPRQVVPIALDSLVQRVAALWACESRVHPDLQSDLIEELSRLEHRVEVLRLRAESGADTPAEAVSDCARIYLWLREHWTGSVAA